MKQSQRYIILVGYLTKIPKKVLGYIKENPKEFEFMTDKEKIIKAVQDLYEDDEISPYDSSDESDFSTEEFRWSEFEERTAEEILCENK